MKIKELLVSRKFWTAILMLVIVLVGVVVPDFDLDVDQAVGYLLIAIPLMIGTAIDPGIGWRGVLQSRKFWAAAVGFIVLTLDAFKLIIPFGISPEILITIALTIGGYISSVALEKPKTKIY